jgi:AcrR family transcriptional regulator
MRSSDYTNRMAPSRNGTASKKPPNGAKRARLAPAERRAQIVAAAKEVFIESGFTAARAKDVAERAGITEAFLYRCFHSKEEIFRLAVEEPLLEFAERLLAEEHDLAAREGVSPKDVLGHLNELLLGYLVEIAPLLAAAVFADATRGRDIYSNVIVPGLRGAVRAALAEIPDTSGRLDTDLLVDAILGVHFAVALEGLLDDQPLDVGRVARQLTKLLADSVIGTEPMLASA